MLNLDRLNLHFNYVNVYTIDNLEFHIYAKLAMTSEREQYIQIDRHKNIPFKIFIISACIFAIILPID